MVKIRDAAYCNLKLLLIFLVIYGHLIEPKIWETPVLMEQYRWIYLFHMPAFAFLSGLFVNSAGACLSQIKRMLPIYIFLQTGAVFLGNGAVKPLTPYWHLWYLLSCCAWCAMGWLWFRFCRGKGKLLILVCALLAGCGAGYIQEVGRAFSLSRTLVFFPYFFTGLICDPKTPWHRLRWGGLAVLVLSAVVMSTYKTQISAVFLYQAAPYGSRENGFFLRLICYFSGFSIGLFLLSFVPAVRLPFTRAGTDTMTAYLTHAPFVLAVRELELHWTAYPLITVVFLYAVHKITQWHSNMYGIANSGLSLRLKPHP